ncbi:MAG TPA: AAA family ATPase, partial [Candidatus Limnocylindrales bacterium]|nr:AAA family ATPase [Candidatus Limnocylindrales bacterium]
AGLAILDGLADLNERTPGLALSVRIGINTGEAVVALDARPSAGEGMVTGDVVNTAARIESQAPVNGVAVGEGTFRATERVFEYQALEPITAKGKAEPVPVWQAVAPRARFGADVLRSMATPLVGRELDFGLLRGTFDKVVADEAVQLVTVVGEPGVGKSRLVAELFAYTDALQRVVRWRQGRCLPYGEGITFWALGEIVKAHAGVLESDPPADAQLKLEQALPAGDEMPWLRARLLPLLGIDPGISAPREESFAAWRRFLESIAEDGPAVLVFEDIHWADESMLAFLEYFADWAQGIPLLVVCTARPELYERHPTWGSGLRNAATIRLSPLSDADTVRLVSTLLEQAELPPETQKVLLARAGGNPLYAEEFVRMLRDSDMLDADGKLRRGVEVAFPDSLQALIAARLDTLPADRKGLLQDAAVIGKVFWSGAVAAMGERASGDVDQVLHELARKELVRPFRHSSMEGEQELGFWHVIVRDVAYGQVPRASRAAKHITAVAWLEGKAGERVEDVAEVLAYHTGEAIELAKATGDTGLAAQLAPAARRYALLAAERALGLDTTKAVTLFERAVDLTPTDDSEYPRVMLRFADALGQVGRYPDSADAAERALAGFEAVSNVEGAAEALTIIGLSRSRIGDQASAVKLAERAVALLETVPPGPVLVATLAQLAAARVVDASLRTAIDAADRALSLAEELGLPVPARALGYHGAAMAMLGEREGFAELERAIELLVESGAGNWAATAMHNLAVSIWEIDGPAAALPKMIEAVTFARERGIGLATASSVIASGWLAVTGRLDEALATIGSIRAELESTGQVEGLLRTNESWALLHLAKGDRVEAAAAASAALAGARQLKTQRSLAMALRPAIETGVASPQEAREMLEQLAADADLRDDHDYVGRVADFVDAAANLGDLDLARRLLEGVSPSNPLYARVLKQAQARIAEAEGDLGRAAALFGDAAEGWREWGETWNTAASLLAQGRCLAGAGDPAAGGAFSEARAAYAEMGASARVAECDELIAQAAD